MDGGEPKPLAGLANDENTVGGVRTGARLPSVVSKVDLASGHKAARKDWTPADPAGITFAAVCLAHDGQSYVYSCSRFLSDLYLVEGLR